jgi:hypothetical protein
MAAAAEKLEKGEDVSFFKESTFFSLNIAFLFNLSWSMREKLRGEERERKEGGGKFVWIKQRLTKFYPLTNETKIIMKLFNKSYRKD